MKNVLFGLLSLTTIGLFTLPATAKPMTETQQTGDRVIMQNSYQGSYQNGYGNQATQESMQIHREMNGKRRRGQGGSYGAVQNVDQYQEQVGEMNTTGQTIIQRTEMRNGSRRRNR